MHANVSVQESSVIGTFLDFENYDKVGSRGACYGLSYDQKILDDFAADESIVIPVLPTAARHQWLVDNGHQAAFEQFQIGSWRDRLRGIRQAVDAINPSFRMAIYPQVGTLFINEAVYPEWSTAQAPLILADASTYARPAEYLRQAPSLEGNKFKIQEHISFIQSLGFPFEYMGGIDPILEPGNAEFCGVNADQLAFLSDGYWVFYEGPTYQHPDHIDYFNWFTMANTSISSGAFNLHTQARVNPELTGPTSITGIGSDPVVVHEGLGITLHEDIAAYVAAPYDARYIESLSSSYLAGADAVIFQSSIRWRPEETSVRDDIRDFVMNGGSVFMTHLGWAERGCTHPETTNGQLIVDIHDPAVTALFPEIGSWTMSAHPASDGWRVRDQALTVSANHPALGLIGAGTQYTTDSDNHMILSPGVSGTTVITNTHGEAVCVVGTVGLGRVVLFGTFFGYTSSTHPYLFTGLDRTIFYSILGWLTGSPQPPPPPGSGIIVEDLSIAPNAGPNGWSPVSNSDTMAPPSFRSNDDGGKLVINTLGEPTASVNYSQPNSVPHNEVPWINAELIAAVTGTAGGSIDGLGTAVGVQNPTFQYAMGVKVEDLGAGVYETSVVIFDRLGGAVPVPLASYVVPDTGLNTHRYNAEYDGTNLNVFVDGYQGDAPNLVIPSAGFAVGGSPLLIFGDIRAAAEAIAEIYEVAFSDGETLLPVYDFLHAEVPASDVMEVAFQSIAGQSYRLESTADPIGGPWTPVGPTVIGTGEVMFLHDPTAGADQNSYRVLTW